MNETTDIHEKARKEGVSAHLVLKEALHLFVLDFLFQKGAFTHLVFQGGTALRICYHGIRYSEDLDFVLKGKTGAFARDLSGILKELPANLERSALFVEAASLKLQKESAAFKRYTLRVKAEGFHALDKTNLEVAAVPSYENQSLLVRNEGMNLSPAVCVETPREILSDKLCAFGSRDYVKGRDLWDIYYLVHELRVEMDKRAREMALQKVSDYGIGQGVFVSNLGRRIARLSGEGGKILKTEMDRFLPAAYRKVFGPGYAAICLEAEEVLSRFHESVVKK